MRPNHRFLPLAALLLPLTAASSGGWATITVEDLPDYLVAGQPIDLAFTIRQHGVDLLDGLRPSIEAHAGKLEANAQGSQVKAASGRYAARLVLPQPGDWKITIHSGFGRSDVTLLSIPVVANGQKPAITLTDAQRGHRLFVAKGCLTCHHRADVEGSAEVGMAPDLSGRVLPVEYVKPILADPSILPGKSGARMPNLNLKAAEITALAAFVSTPSRASR